VTMTARPAAAVGAAGEAIVGWARKRYRFFLLSLLSFLLLSLFLLSLELSDTQVYEP